MKDLGYTTETSDGLKFASDQNPDVDHVAVVCAELFCASFELDLYCKKNHPFPSSIHSLLSLEDR